MTRTIVLALAVATWSTAAVTSPFRPLPGQPRTADRRGPPPAADTGGGVADLPYARGRRFAALDDYLVYRREQSAIDLPWYDEVAPGVYELRTSMRPAPRRQRFTRDELARKFGFVP